MQNDTENIIYQAEDLKNILHIGIHTAYNLMKQKDFPSYKINSRYFVTKTDFENWLKQIKGKKYRL